MDDNVQSIETHFWTLGDFIEKRTNWSQNDEVRLVKYLEQLSNKIAQGAKNTLNEIDDLVDYADNTAIKIANINNEFQLLAEKQFIENKVQEEDETVQITSEKTKTVIQENSDDEKLVENLKTTLKNSFNVIKTHFEKVTIVVSDSDDDDLKHEETILRPRKFYKKLQLPTFTGILQSEVEEVNDMSSDSDYDIKKSKSFEKEESLSSNEVIETKSDTLMFMDENNQMKCNSQIEVNSQNSEPQILKSTPESRSIIEDVFSPPPLNDNEDEDDNDYNIFGQYSKSDMYGDQNLWDDNESELSHEPPLPVCTDNFTDKFIQPVKDENHLISDVQQSLNDELRKRFHKDILSADNMNNVKIQPDEPSLKIKLPKGAVNVLGGSFNKSLNQAYKQTPNIELPNENQNEFYNINQTVNNKKTIVSSSSDQSIQIITSDVGISVHKEKNSNKKKSFFDPESEDEDLFTSKSNVTVVESDLKKKKEVSTNIDSESIDIVSEYDSEKPLFESNSTNKSKQIKSKIEFSEYLSDNDDLFNEKPSIIQDLRKIEDKKNRKLKSAAETTENYYKNKSNNNNSTSLLNNKIKENTQKNLILSLPKDTKKSIFLFSSDEEDDLFNVENSKVNVSKIVENQHSKVSNNLSTIKSKTKVELFDSSSDEDLFSISKSNKNKKIIATNEKKSIIEASLDDKISSEVQSTDTFNQTTVDQFNSSVDKLARSAIISNQVFNENKNVLSVEISDKLKHSNNSKNIDLKVNDNLNSSEEEFFSPVSNFEQFNDKNFSQNNNFACNNIENSNECDNKLTSDKKEKNNFQNIVTNKMFKQNELSSILSSDDEELFTSKLKNFVESKNNNQVSEMNSTLSFNKVKQIESNDSFDGAIISSQKLSNEPPTKLPGKLPKNMGSFINITSLSPNSLQSSKLSKSDTENSIENLDDLPNSEAKLYSAGKERVKIQVKRRPQSRKARQTAAHMSSIVFENNFNLPGNSHKDDLTSDFVDQSTSVISNDNESNLKQNCNVVATPKCDVLESGSVNINSSSDLENIKKNSIKSSENILKKFDLDTLSDDDGDIFESLMPPHFNKNLHKTTKIYNSNEKSKEIVESNFEKNTIDLAKDLYLVDDCCNNDNIFEPNKEISITDECNIQNKIIITETQSDNIKEEVINVKTKIIKGIMNTDIPSFLETENSLKTNNSFNQNGMTEKKDKIIEIKSTVSNISSNTATNMTEKKKGDSLFSFDEDDDDDDDESYIFFSKSRKAKKVTSNLFDSDDDLDFNQKFKNKSKDNLTKTQSLFDDSSDDDLFDNTSKTTSVNEKFAKKPTEHSNRVSFDGYVKLTAEGVASNPLDNKE
ncbi:protein PFC0760c-like isoform X2 [Daktulosphaira vitifoliae]|uniref:protein PFC0760c-like isoform X2 n=1 Tax=Daktulosphaira vitifoliae TaxID=58002 RepID=UPI0021A98F0F|nr:protein PFC0760c-like isoform X2 [Daktulosphaira vitifoliae]